MRNPNYEKQVRLAGGNRWGKHKYWKYYTENSAKLSEISIPRGQISRLRAFFDKAGIKYQAVYKKNKTKSDLSIISTLTLRDYQSPIVEQALNHKEGVIKMSTGSGKTIVAIELARRLRLKTTIIVDRTLLLNNIYNEIKKFFSYECGRIGDGKNEIKDITVVTIQSLVNKPALARKLAKQTGLLIVDECHAMVGSNKRTDIIEEFYPEYIYGLTATPLRTDGKHPAIFYFFGQQIVEYDMPAMLPTVEVFHSCADIGTTISYDDIVQGIAKEVSGFDYHDIINDMVENESRNRLIKGLIIGEMLEGRKILVLTKRVEHYKTIYEDFAENETVLFISAQDKNRHELMKQLKNGEKEYSVIFGTVSLLSVGIDIPSLDTLIFACDMKSEVSLIQSVGRIRRMLDGKPNPKVYDIWDSRNKILSSQFWSRRKTYLKHGFEVLMPSLQDKK